MNERAVKVTMVFGKNYFYGGRKYSRFAEDGVTPLHYEVPRSIARELLGLKTTRGIPYFSLVLDLEDDEVVTPPPPKPEPVNEFLVVKIRLPEDGDDVSDLDDDEDPLEAALAGAPVATNAVVSVEGDEGEEV